MVYDLKRLRDLKAETVKVKMSVISFRHHIASSQLVGTKQAIISEKPDSFHQDTKFLLSIEKLSYNKMMIFGVIEQNNLVLL